MELLVAVNKFQYRKISANIIPEEIMTITYAHVYTLVNNVLT